MANAGKRTGRLQAIIAENVRSLRVLKGISQEELAEVSGYHRTYCSRKPGFRIGRAAA